MSRQFRRAGPGDIESLLKIDPVTEKDSCRREYIARADQRSGTVGNLDPDDPELIFVKFLSQARNDRDGF